MTFWRTLSPALFVCPSLIFAASKEIIELQRDLAQVQEQVRALQFPGRKIRRPSGARPASAGLGEQDQQLRRRPAEQSPANQ